MKLKFFLFFIFFGLFCVSKKDSRSKRFIYFELNSLLKKGAWFDSSGKLKTIDSRKYVYSEKKGLYKLIGSK